jgi:hypothetical protein
MTEEQLRILDLALFDLSSDSGVRWSGEYMAEVAAALRALLDEVAALKARDPLAEMWRELSEYQPMADRDGHGESWRRMCEERTEAAAHAAAWARGASPTPSEWSWASRAADAAARAATEAAICAQRAIAAIRKAKEAKP